MKAEWKRFTKFSDGSWSSGWVDGGTHCLRAHAEPTKFVFLMLDERMMDGGCYQHGWHEWSDVEGGTKEVTMVAFSLTAAVEFCERMLSSHCQQSETPHKA